MAQPTSLFTVAGVAFYEHPTLGDEHPLLAQINVVGPHKATQVQYVATDFWEKPDHFEAEDFKATLKDRPSLEV